MSTPTSTTPNTTAGERLARALESAAHRGDVPPCAGSEAWTSEEHEERSAAAKSCVHCPVLALCDASAREWRPSFGVFGGLDWTDPKKRPRRST